MSARGNEVVADVLSARLDTQGLYHLIGFMAEHDPEGVARALESAKKETRKK